MMESNTDITKVPERKGKKKSAPPKCWRNNSQKLLQFDKKNWHIEPRISTNPRKINIKNYFYIYTYVLVKSLITEEKTLRAAREKRLHKENDNTIKNWLILRKNEGVKNDIFRKARIVFLPAISERQIHNRRFQQISNLIIMQKLNWQIQKFSTTWLAKLRDHNGASICFHPKILILKS